MVVARIVAQTPEPRKHRIHNYGRDANAARAKRERDRAVADAGSHPVTATASEPDSAERNAARKRWANLPPPHLRGRFGAGRELCARDVACLIEVLFPGERAGF